MTIEIGACHTDNYIIGSEHTAQSMGNKGVNVLGTPMLVQFAEFASHKLLVPNLSPQQASVGIRVDIRHLKATPVGMQVWIKAVLCNIDRSRYVFEVSGRDEQGDILSGFHERFIVELESFMARTNAT
jgi:predicted thioesterase